MPQTTFARHAIYTALLATASAATPFAVAQEGATTLEEVLVTAQRREQSLQEVPMAVSAFTRQQLDDLQADNLDSIQGAVPNLNLVQGRGSNSSVNIFLRGIGQPDALQSFDPAVGVYLDDVYMSRIQGSMFKLYDIERIEVLRGPQGTLYGKNTPGGAIKLITRNPGEELEAAASLTLGNYDRTQGSVYVAGPLTDTLSASFSVLHDERDGFVTDPIDGEEYNDENTTVMRLKSVWTPNDRFQAIFSADYTQEDVALTLGRAEAPLVSVELSDGSVVPRFVPSNDDFDFDTSTSLGDRDGQETDHWGVNLTLAYDLSDTVTLKSITSYRDLESNLFIDIDATALELGDVFVGIDQDQFSQELQLLGDNGSNLNWVVGAYYLQENVPSAQEAFADDFLLFLGSPVSFLRTIEDDLETTSYALFGQLDWAINDQWSAGVGIRYTYEEKEYSRSTSTFSNVLGNADPAFAFEDDDDWDAWTPTFTVGYTPSDTLNFYGRVARGFKSGGFNGRANSADDVSTFDPETVWSLELGAKAIMLDGRLSANFAVFESRYEDFQARVSVGDGIDFRFPVLNAAELDISGAELEVTWLATEALELSAQVGYLDAEYGDDGFSGSDGIMDEPAFTPDWTGRLAAAYNFSLPGGSSIRVGADASYRDDMFLSVENVAPLTEGSYWLVNAFAAWTSADAHWNVTAGVRNATDEVYRTEGQEFRSVGNIQTAYYGDPRTYSVSLNYLY